MDSADSQIAGVVQHNRALAPLHCQFPHDAALSVGIRLAARACRTLKPPIGPGHRAATLVIQLVARLALLRRAAHAEGAGGSQHHRCQRRRFPRQRLGPIDGDEPQWDPWQERARSSASQLVEFAWDIGRRHAHTEHMGGLID
jgi:hypothetical protein